MASFASVRVAPEPQTPVQTPVQTPIQHDTIQVFLKSSICGMNQTAKRTILLIQELELSQLQKISLMNRYLTIYEEFNNRSFLYSKLYHVGHFVVTVGSLIVPALLSIQYTAPTPGNEPGDMSMKVYWVTWIFSLMVTTFNGILTLFRVDKKYFMLYTNVEHVQSEISQYIHLSGRYSGYYTPNSLPTHRNQFIFICHNIEKIKLKQVSEEYYKQIEQSDEKQNKGAIFHPTPTSQQLLEHKAELARALFQTSSNPIVDEDKEGKKDKEDKEIQGWFATASSSALPM